MNVLTPYMAQLKLAAGVALLLALVVSHGVAYYKGRESVQEELAGKIAQVYEKRRELDRELEQFATERSEAQREVNNAYQRALEAIGRTSGNPSCDLGDDELRAMEELAAEVSRNAVQ